MEKHPYRVLVKVDENGLITAINSSAFVDGVDWMQIDEGYSDRYHHAQNNYLAFPLTDERGVYRYKLVDGVVVQRTTAEMDADYAARPAPEPTTVERLSALEATTDDIILMMADMIGG